MINFSIYYFYKNTDKNNRQKMYIMKSLLNETINYKENKTIDIEDIDHTTSIYEYNLYNLPVEIALGKANYIYTKYNIIHYSIYLIQYDQPVSKIGVFEIKSDELIHNINENDIVDLNKGNILIYITEKKLYNILGSREYNTNNYKEKIKIGDDLKDDNNVVINSIDENIDDIFKMKINENNKSSQEMIVKVKNVLLEEETKQQADDERKNYKHLASNSWVSKFMNNNNYDIIDNSGKGDSIFEVICESYKKLGKKISIIAIRNLLISNLSDEKYLFYKNLYSNIESYNKEQENEIKKIKKALYVIKKRIDIVNYEDKKILLDEATDLSNRYKELLNNKNLSKELLQKYEYMKNINNIDELKEYMKTSSHIPDDWCINIIEKKMKIKFIFLSEDAYKYNDLDSILKCNNNMINNENIEPDYYILISVNDIHNNYKLITYKSKSLLKFSEVPYDIKSLIINKCLENNAGSYYLLKDVQEYKKKLKLNEQLGNEELNEDNLLSRDLYNKDIIFMFYKKSNPKISPGYGSGEKIKPENVINYIRLNKNKNWRQKLDDDYSCPFSLDDKRWLTVTHYILGSQFKKGFPDFYNEFSLDSNSKISNDVEIANYAGKVVNNKGNEYRNKEIIVDNDYYSHGNDSRCNIERNNALIAKFTDNLDLKEILLNTGDAKLNKFSRRKYPEPDDMLMKLRKKLVS